MAATAVAAEEEAAKHFISSLKQHIGDPNDLPDYPEGLPPPMTMSEIRSYFQLEVLKGEMYTNELQEMEGDSNRELPFVSLRQERANLLVSYAGMISMSVPHVRGDKLLFRIKDALLAGEGPLPPYYCCTCSTEDVVAAPHGDSTCHACGSWMVVEMPNGVPPMLSNDFHLEMAGRLNIPPFGLFDAAGALEVECSICHEEMEDIPIRAHCESSQMEDIPIRAHCESSPGHFFHPKCLLRWIDIKGRSATCPLCRAPLPVEDPLSVIWQQSRRIIEARGL